jgi:hypothetical protein
MAKRKKKKHKNHKKAIEPLASLLESLRSFFVTPAWRQSIPPTMRTTTLLLLLSQKSSVLRLIQPHLLLGTAMDCSVAQKETNKRFTNSSLPRRRRRRRM